MTQLEVDEELDPDTSQLSEETLDELVEKDVISEEDRNQFEKRIKLQEARPETEPTKERIRDRLSSTVSYVKNAIGNTLINSINSVKGTISERSLSKYTSYGTISKVEPLENKVKLSITHPDSVLRSTTLRHDSKAYANY